MSLSGKSILVTGAASGIGRAVALQAHEQGMTVIAVDYDAAGLEALGQERPEFTCVTADVMNPADVDAAVAAANGRLDVLCNNAGLMDRMQLVDEISEEDWARVIGVNLTGPYMLCKRVVPLMIAQGGGAIVNVASVAGVQGGRAGAAYTASKHGMIGLTKNIAATLAVEGIRCNAVCPGGTRHGSRGAHAPGAVHSERGAARIVGRDRDRAESGTPEGIASVVLFLADPDASARVNGAVIIADDAATAF